MDCPPFPYLRLVSPSEPGQQLFPARTECRSFDVSSKTIARNRNIEMRPSTFEALVRQGMIAPNDLKLFHVINDVHAAFDLLRSRLPKDAEVTYPAIAKSKTVKRTPL